MSDTAPSTRIAMVIYPNLTQLDLTGPFEVLSRMPGTVVDLVGRTMDPVASDRGLVLTPTATFDDCPAPEILFVPGGPGQVEAMGRRGPGRLRPPRRRRRRFGDVGVHRFVDPRRRRVAAGQTRHLSLDLVG